MKELKEPNTMRYRDKFVIREKRKVVKIELFNSKGQKIELYSKPIPHRNDYDLMSYYYTLNPELCNLQHFGLVQNECIKRGLIGGEIQSLNDFNTNIGA